MDGPMFQLPWKAAVGQTMTLTYPTGGAAYSLTITAGDEWDSTYDFLIWLFDEIQAEASTAMIWPVIDADGKVSLVSQARDFDFAWNDPVVGGMGALMGFSTMTASDVASYTGDAMPHRNFNPGIRMLVAPTFSRRTTAPMASMPLLSGHRHTTQVVNPAQPGGFFSARFLLSVYVAEADFAVQDYTTTQFYRAISFISGERDPNQIFDLQDGTYSGYSGATDIATCTEFDDLDDLPPGGAAENPFSYFTGWLDPDGDIVDGDYENYRDILGDRQSIWYLHPDLSAVDLSPQYDRMRNYWIMEFEAFTAEAV